MDPLCTTFWNCAHLSSSSSGRVLQCFLWPWRLGEGKEVCFPVCSLSHTHTRIHTSSFIVLMPRKPDLLYQRSLGQSRYADVLRSVVMKIGSCFDQSTCCVISVPLSPPEPIWYPRQVSIMSPIQMNTFSISGWIRATDSISRMCSSKNEIKLSEFFFHHSVSKNDWTIIHVTISIQRVLPGKCLWLSGRTFLREQTLPTLLFFIVLIIFALLEASRCLRALNVAVPIPLTFLHFCGSNFRSSALLKELEFLVSGQRLFCSALQAACFSFYILCVWEWVCSESVLLFLTRQFFIFYPFILTP